MDKLRPYIPRMRTVESPPAISDPGESSPSPFPYTISFDTPDPSPHGYQDFARVTTLGDHLLVVVADGAGNSDAGSMAAKQVHLAVHQEHFASLEEHRPCDWVACLDSVDHDLAKTAGRAAAVILEIAPSGRVLGASAGDCEAWVVVNDSPSSYKPDIDLTARQNKKPMLGDGAIPVAFEHQVKKGSKIVAATDGLWKHIRPLTVQSFAHRMPLNEVGEQLVECIRMIPGAFQDDVTVVVVEIPS